MVLIDNFNCSQTVVSLQPSWNLALSAKSCCSAGILCRVFIHDYQSKTSVCYSLCKSSVVCWSTNYVRSITKKMKCFFSTIWPTEYGVQSHDYLKHDDRKSHQDIKLRWEFLCPIIDWKWFKVSSVSKGWSNLYVLGS